jgi:SAM-dependent methyltransferase
VDTALRNYARITAVDISAAAVRLYARHNPAALRIEQADIFRLPFADGSFDGVYNLGVMEHFTRAEITRVLTEFRRVLRPGGKVLLFWPVRHAPSVWVLHAIHFLLRGLGVRREALHPPEVSLLASRADAAAHLGDAGFHLVAYTNGPSDLFIQAVVVGTPTSV